MNLQNGSAITFLDFGTELAPRVTVSDSHGNVSVTEEVAADISRTNLVATLTRIIESSGPFFRPSAKSLRISLDTRLRAVMVGT